MTCADMEEPLGRTNNFTKLKNQDLVRFSKKKKKNRKLRIFFKHVKKIKEIAILTHYT